jgi:hypothetical protein
MRLRPKETRWMSHDFLSSAFCRRRSYSQTAIFSPKGLLGFVYWYALYPIHSLIFRGLIRKLAKRAADINRHVQPQTRLS